MSTLSFLAPKPMSRLSQLARAGRGIVAVPFLGADAATILPLKAGSVLITRVTRDDVKRGLVSPQEVLRFLKRGVEVHNCENLHAKVYVFGRRAVIGSANVSKSSSKMVEAAIEVSDPGTVAKAKAFIEGLRVDRVDAQFVQSLVPLYRHDQIGGWSTDRDAAAGPRSKTTKAIHSRVWVMPVEEEAWSEEALRTADQGRPLASQRMIDPATNRLEEINWDGAGWKHLAPGARVIQRTVKGRGYLYDPPARVVHIERYDNERACIVFVERRKRLGKISSSKVRATLGLLSTHFTRTSTRLHLVRSGEAAVRMSGMWPSLSSST